MAVQDFTLYDLLVRNASCFGDRVAVVTEAGDSRTFAELLDRVDRLAAGLAQRGLAQGDRLCILAHNSAAYLELYFACARLGVVSYPINWRLQSEEIERLLGRARPKGFIVDAACFDSLPTAPGKDSAIELWLSFGALDAEGFTDIAALYIETEAPPVDVAADDPFTIIATAAVEIVPRGAVLSHRNVLCSNVQEIASVGLTADDGNLVALPLFHIAGLGHCLAYLHAGAKNVIQPKYDAARAVELIDEHRLTHISDFPPVLTTLLDAAKESGSSLATLRHVSGLDAPATIERLESETGASFWTGFGQTETSGFVTLQRFSDRPGAAGKMAELSKVRLVDDFDREVPIGTPGEILVRGPLVFLGYADEPEVTEHTFRGGWHHTGDVGRFDDEGYLHYVRRKPEKELIKPGGENVYPAEVEAVIVELPGVRAACVFGVPHPKWGEGIKAAIELEAGSELTADQVIEHVGQRIARFKRPHFVDFTDVLPRTDDGSIDREAVKTRFASSSTGNA